MTGTVDLSSIQFPLGTSTDGEFWEEGSLHRYRHASLKIMKIRLLGISDFVDDIKH